MIKAIVVDDENPALKIVEKFCSDSGKINLLEKFNKPSEAIEFLKNNTIDLIFLDVNMPSITGLEFYKNLKNPPQVIFTTAYAEYAIDGFNLNAIDYLLKPFTYERFLIAISKAEMIIKSNTKISENTHLSIRADYALHKIPFENILYFEGYDDYVKIHIQNEKTIVARVTMKSILEKLNEEKFIRVHRSYIVAIDKIKALKSKSLFIADAEIPVSNSYEEALKSKVAGIE